MQWEPEGVSRGLGCVSQPGGGILKAAGAFLELESLARRPGGGEGHVGCPACETCEGRARVRPGTKCVTNIGRKRGRTDRREKEEETWTQEPSEEGCLGIP